MKVTWKKRFASALCAALLLGTMAGCGDQNAASSPSASNAPSASQSAPTGGSEDPVTIKVFSNLTDRTTGQGLIEQTLFDNYMDEHPNVTIEVEALDDESYKTKFKAYAAGSSMPDLVNIWCSPSFLDEVVEAGVLAELNADDYTDYGFSEGSLDGVTYDGKLYGLPRNTDVLGFYYNKDLFAQYNLEVPTTWDELLTAAQTFQEAGIIPVAMDGQDKWPLAHFINCMVSGQHHVRHHGRRRHRPRPDRERGRLLADGLCGHQALLQLPGPVAAQQRQLLQQRPRPAGVHDPQHLQGL